MTDRYQASRKADPYPLVYRWRAPKTWLGAYLGEVKVPGKHLENPLYLAPCRVLASGRGRGPWNHLIEMSDGRRFVVARWAVGRPRRKG